MKRNIHSCKSPRDPAVTFVFVGLDCCWLQSDSVVPESLALKVHAALPPHPTPPHPFIVRDQHLHRELFQSLYC